jgi:Protein of unknown function (DUF732)
MTGKWSTACAIVLLAVALLAAVPASADSTDDAFIAALTKNGIAITDRDAATATGQSVCDGFDRHEKSSLLAMQLMTRSGLSLKQSSYFVGVSVSAYCPEYVGKTDNSTRWLNPGPPLM